MFCDLVISKLNEDDSYEVVESYLLVDVRYEKYLHVEDGTSCAYALKNGSMIAEIGIIEDDAVFILADRIVIEGLLGTDKNWGSLDDVYCKWQCFPRSN